jgi:hypothetical protein
MAEAICGGRSDGTASEAIIPAIPHIWCQTPERFTWVSLLRENGNKRPGG